MSINNLTNYLNKDFLYLETISNISTQDAQNIVSIAKSLEASALEFESQQSRKRKIKSNKKEGQEQSAKRARVQDTITALKNTNFLPLSHQQNQSTFSENSYPTNSSFIQTPLPNFELEFANKELKDNKEFVLKIIKNFGDNLEFVSERLKNDKEVVLSAVQNTGYALKFASNNLKDDEEVVFTALQRFGVALCFASERLRNNKDFLFTALKNFVFSLEFASQRLRNNKKFMMNAIRNSAGLALQFASEELKNDPEIVVASTNKSFFVKQPTKNIKEFISLIQNLN